jgi:hypothetical protein
MGHCCNDPRPESSTQAASIGGAMLIKGILLQRRTKAVRWPLRALGSCSPCCLLFFYTIHTGEKKRRKKRSARYGAPRKYHQRRSSQCYPPGCGVSTRRRRPKRRNNRIMRAEFRKVTKMAKSVCTFMAAGAVRNRLMSE